MRITGTIVDAAGRALPGFRVVAYHGDVNLEKEKVLGACATDKAGAYSLHVDMVRHPCGVNVRVAVLDRKEAELWSRPVQFNVKADLQIDAIISDARLGITEHQRLLDKIAP